MTFRERRLKSISKIQNGRLIKEAERLRGIVEKHAGVSMLGGGRKQANVDARRVFCMIMRETGFSLKDIGRYIGRDHSTVLYNISTGADDVDYFPQFRDMYNRIKEEFLSEYKQELDIPDPAIRSAINNLKESIDILESKVKSLTLQLTQHGIPIKEDVAERVGEESLEPVE